MSAALRSFLAVPLISLSGDGVRLGVHAEARLFGEPVSLQQIFLMSPVGMIEPPAMAETSDIPALPSASFEKPLARSISSGCGQVSGGK